ncbi:MAG: Fic family protein [Verrucomicrobiales bacterium]|jgi:Fic family protein
MVPPDLQPSNEMLCLTASIDEFKGEWRVVERIEPQRLASLRRLATIESVGSSTRIEGAKLSDREVEALLGNLESNSFRSRDEQEVAGYAYVMEMVQASWADLPVTEGIVLQLHRDLLRYSTKDERHRGEWKSLPNHVVALDADGKEIGIVFETAAPFDTPQLMSELLDWLAAEERE